MTPDYPAALAAARDALDNHDYGHEIPAYVVRDLLAALDAARGTRGTWAAMLAASPAQQPAVAVPAGYVSMPVERVQHVIDLLAERAHLNNARSPAHNARLLLEATMTAALVQQPAAAVPGGYNEDEIADACMMAEVSDSKYEAIIAYLGDNRRAMLAAERKGGES